MDGLGETHDELVSAFEDLASTRSTFLTRRGQYLRPSERHLPVVRYWHPDESQGARRRRRTPSGSSTSPPGRSCRSSSHADEAVKHAFRRRAARRLASLRPLCSRSRTTSRRSAFRS
jgi:lipoic acid synthetase